MKKTTKVLCAICKGVRKLCGAKVCPILVKRSLMITGIKIDKKELDGISEWVLVGEHGYPHVRFGPVSAISEVSWNPEKWARERWDFSEILKIRIQTIYSFQRKHIRKTPSIYDPIGEASASLKPVNAEIILKKAPKIRLKLDADIPPIGGSSPLKKFELMDNPMIPKKVESVIEDDIKAQEAVIYLYKLGFSYYYIQKIFSAGFLGMKHRRKLVPTRWSITAVDSIIGNFCLTQIKNAPSIAKAKLYYHEYLGNHYYIILIPSNAWAMEMFEIWLPNSVWLKGVGKPFVINIHESYDGKPNDIDGGYFAIRTSVLDFLKRENRKAAVLAIRIITPAYIAPVGSWQIRESIKLALSKKPVITGDLSEIIEFITNKVKVVGDIQLNEKSWLLKNLKTRTLDEFFN